jgi:hypothetical protein
LEELSFTVGEACRGGVLEKVETRSWRGRQLVETGGRGSRWAAYGGGFRRPPVYVGIEGSLAYAKRTRQMDQRQFRR